MKAFKTQYCMNPQAAWAAALHPKKFRLAWVYSVKQNGLLSDRAASQSTAYSKSTKH